MNDTMSYLIEDDEDRSGRWTHFVTSTSGYAAAKYHDERTISASQDPWAIARTAADHLGLPEPDFVDHDGDYIHFGYTLDFDE